MIKQDESYCLQWEPAIVISIEVFQTLAEKIHDHKIVAYFADAIVNFGNSWSI
jgi:hypothetical protein